MTTITALVAQGKPQIGMHIKTGLSVGLTPDEIVGCIVHLIPYTGFPSVLNALKVAQEVFKEEGVTISNNEWKEIFRWRGLPIGWPGTDLTLLSSDTKKRQEKHPVWMEK